MKDSGFCVEIWDFTPFLSPEDYKLVRVSDPIDYQKSNRRLFIEKAETIQEIKNLKQDTMIIFIMLFDHEHYFLYRELSKQNILYACIITNAIPFYKNNHAENYFFNKYWLTNFTRKIKELNLEKIKKHVFNRVPSSLLIIQLPEYIFAGGYQSLINYKFPIGKKTKVIWGHILDYDLYLKGLQKTLKNELVSKKYIVFIDACMPFHPDYIHKNIKPSTTSEIYYPTMYKFFCKVEKEIGFKIIIAAHPKSKYEEYPEYFDGRRVICGKTKESIRDSEFVLMHGSTSLSFAVLYHKPVLLLTTDEIEQFRVDRESIREFSSELNKGVINIDRDYKINWDKELRIDAEAYVNYKEKYIKRRDTKEDFFGRL